MNEYKDEITIIGKKFANHKLSTGFKREPKKSDIKAAVQQLLEAYNMDVSNRSRITETEIALNALDMIFGNFDILRDHDELIPEDIFIILIELCGAEIISIRKIARQCVLHMLIATNVFEFNFIENGIIPFCVSLINPEEEEGRKAKIMELIWGIQILGCLAIVDSETAQQISEELPLDVLLTIIEDYPEIADEAAAYTSLLLYTLQDPTLCMNALQIFGIFYDKGKEQRRAAAIDGLATCMSLWEDEFPVGIFSDYKLFAFVSDCFHDEDDEDYIFINRRAAEIYQHMARLGYLERIPVDDLYEMALASTPSEAVLNIVAFRVLREMVKSSDQIIISQEFIEGCMECYDILPNNTKKALLQLLYELCNGTDDVKIFLIEKGLFEILSDVISNESEKKIKTAIVAIHDLVQFVIRIGRKDLLEIASDKLNESDLEELQENDDEEIAFNAGDTCELIAAHI